MPERRALSQAGDRHSILALVLDDVHGGIGGAEEVIGGGGMIGARGDAHTRGDGRDVDAVTVEHAARFDRDADRLGDLLGIGGVGERQDDHELITAEARRDVTRAHEVSDYFAEIADRAAADEVSVGVDDGFEVVEVEHQQ